MSLSDITPNLYPTDILKECKTGLCLFGAGFLGANDCIHMHNAKLNVTVLDIDDKKLKEMEELYPKKWTFLMSNATEWVPNTVNNGVLKWDIVSVDAPTNMFEWVRDNFDLIARLANKYLVVTMYKEIADGVADFCDNLDVELVDKMNRSNNGLIELLVFKRAVLSKNHHRG